MGKKTAGQKPIDPVLKALQNSKPRTSPMSDELREKRKRGHEDVAARNFADVPGERERLQN